MLDIFIAIVTRIFSNSYINVFQKKLTSVGTRSSVVNFITYLGLFLASLFFLKYINLILTYEVLFNALIMGILGALGNYFIIKALSIGELSSLAPINSYKPIVAGIVSFIYLGETPSIKAILGILLIIFGTYFLYQKSSIDNIKPILFRVLALIFSGSEAVFIKKIILITDVPTSLFLWILFGMFFSCLFLANNINEIKIKSWLDHIYLIIVVGIMQFSTNYVFSHMNVAYALALFQLSTLLSVFLGINIFNEKDFKKKILASIVMIIGATIIILS